MKKFVAVFLVNLFYLVGTSHAQSSSSTDIFEALNDSNWGESYGESSDDTSDNSIDVTDVHESNSPCLSKEQNTIPHKFLLQLLGSKKIEVSHNPGTGLLRIHGGTMIGNCNSMLETAVAKPKDEVPYTFQVRIKKPCNDDVCPFDIAVVEDEEVVLKKMNFKSNFEGFKQCLKASGVFKDGKIQADNIAAADFIHEEKEVTQSSKLYFLSHGIKGGKQVGKYSKNLIPGKGCYYFEDIKKDGFRIYSKSDLKDLEMEAHFQKVCKSNDYKEINSELPRFEAFSGLESTLESIRNNLILEEVKELHNTLRDSEDLSDVDVARFNEVISDFKNYVISPVKNKLKLMRDLLKSPTNSNKRKLLSKIFTDEKTIQKFLSMNKKDFKKELESELDKEASNLLSLAKSPYLNTNDYVLMLSSSKKAPLKDSQWIGATLNLFEIQNTAHNYGRYNKDYYAHNKNVLKGNRLASGDVIDRIIRNTRSKKRNELSMLNRAAKNPDIDYVAKFENSKEKALSSIDRSIRKLQEKIRKAQYKVRTNCSVEKQKKFWINQRACVEEAQYAVKACTEQIRALFDQRKNIIAKYDAKISKWQNIASDKGKSDKSSNLESYKDFSFDPTSFNSNQQASQNQSLRNPQINWRQAQSNGGFMMNQRPWQTPGINPNYSMQYGGYENPNMAFSGQYQLGNMYGGGMNNFGRFPSYYSGRSQSFGPMGASQSFNFGNNLSGGVNFGGGMTGGAHIQGGPQYNPGGPWSMGRPMNYFNNNLTGPGGVHSFGTPFLGSNPGGLGIGTNAAPQGYSFSF